MALDAPAPPARPDGLLAHFLGAPALLVSTAYPIIIGAVENLSAVRIDVDASQALW